MKYDDALKSYNQNKLAAATGGTSSSGKVSSLGTKQKVVHQPAASHMAVSAVVDDAVQQKLLVEEEPPSPDISLSPVLDSDDTDYSDL